MKRFLTDMNLRDMRYRVYPTKFYKDGTATYALKDLHTGEVLELFDNYPEAYREWNRLENINIELDKYNKTKLFCPNCSREIDEEGFCEYCGWKSEEVMSTSMLSGRKKAFISMPMAGLTSEEIEYQIEHVKSKLPDYDILDSYFKNYSSNKKNSGVDFIAKSLEVLADADLVVFLPGWKDARGCQIEYQVTTSYNIPYIILN